ncbi:hypothetical protein BVG16_05445 [Paenibacillus selenitireducens]|uniref:Uncharacterized protein n=1 Tax=Paenibacillus selenitireducens TaxID=1324314 RepID=A0A1T2XJZ6_9BACL|nr:hypothetical protein [Paenibacillus selenitireducens]OPA80190.1 hypothetical protein BVG16_05445 [Paenibacillus selenitireducens]
MNLIRAYHPDWDYYVLFAESQEIGIPTHDLDGNIVIRPFTPLDVVAKTPTRKDDTYGIPEMFHWLQVQEQYTNVIYLDVESYVCDPLTEVTEALQQGMNMVVVSNPKRPYCILMLALSNQINVGVHLQKWRSEGIQEFIRSVSNKLEIQQPRYQFNLGDDDGSGLEYITGQIFIGSVRLALFHTQWIRDRLLETDLSQNNYQHLIYARKYEMFLNQVCLDIHKYRGIGGENPLLHSPIFLSKQARFADGPSNQPLITPIMAMIWEMRSDLQAAFRDPWGYHRKIFCQWFVIYAPHEYQFTADYIQPVQSSLPQLRFWNMGQKGR